MTLLRAAVALGLALFLTACGTVDLDADPLLKPPQLVDPDGTQKKKTAAARNAVHTLTV